MVNKTLPYEKRAKNKTDYTILIFLIDSNAQFLMKGAWCAWSKSLVLILFSELANNASCLTSKY